MDAIDRLHQGPQHYYLNFYGPPGTVTTIPFADLIEDRDMQAAATFLYRHIREAGNIKSALFT